MSSRNLITHLACPAANGFQSDRKPGHLGCRIVDSKALNLWFDVAQHHRLTKSLPG
jgi:hypothetical protein